MLILKLIFAHLLGDFFTQPYSWVRHKEQHKLKSSRLYLHVLIHVILLSIMLWDIALWPIVLIIGITHLIIDGAKLILQNEQNRRFLFILDQVLHVAILFVVYFIFSDAQLNLEEYITTERATIFISLLVLTQPTAILMMNIFNKWDIATITQNNESLKDAGKYIGILERILVFIFIMVDHWEAVGFLITAKSVFRFGDLKESKHRKLTEYILIGTLISFGIAIITALACKALL